MEYEICGLDYGSPFTARSISYSARSKHKGLIIATQVPTSWADDAYGQGMRWIPPLGQLEFSNDGSHWQKLCDLPNFGTQHDGWTRRPASFSATTARYFRLVLAPGDNGFPIGGLDLSGAARVDQWEIKSGNVVDFSDPDRTPDYAGNEVIDPNLIIDLTEHIDANGKLTWDTPAGNWTILRLGHTPTGSRTKHGRPEGM